MVLTVLKKLYSSEKYVLLFIIFCTLDRFIKRIKLSLDNASPDPGCRQCLRPPPPPPARPPGTPTGPADTPNASWNSAGYKDVMMGQHAASYATRLAHRHKKSTEERCRACLRVHCTENPIDVFPEKELRGLSPNSYIHVSVSDLNIPRIGPHIWRQQNRQTDPGNI